MKYQVVNPSTGQVEQDYPTATDAEIGEILDRAGRGYPAWRRTAMTERSDILRRVAQLYEDRSAELGAIITREMGKTTAEAQGELEFTVGIYRYYADQGPNPARRRAARLRHGRHRAGSGRHRSGRCSGSCPGTTPTTRSPGSPAPT